MGTVGNGGKVEIVVPGLRGGEVVEISVRLPAPGANGTETQRPVGLLKGRIRILANFDEPLEEFDLPT